MAAIGSCTELHHGVLVFLFSGITEGILESGTIELHLRQC